MIALLHFALFPIAFFSFVGLVGLLVTIFWVWMMIDCVLHETSENSSKIAWLLVIIFTHFLGALLYFCIRKQARRI
jgi:putative flippase GtrA